MSLFREFSFLTKRRQVVKSASRFGYMSECIKREQSDFLERLPHLR